MGVGKYSPTVSASYSVDRDWWEKNGGGHGNGKFPDKDCDDDGYDSYGYSANDADGNYIGEGDGVDRLGNTENDYMVGEWDESFENYTYDTYEQACCYWGYTLLGTLKKQEAK